MVRFPWNKKLPVRSYRTSSFFTWKQKGQWQDPPRRQAQKPVSSSLPQRCWGDMRLRKPAHLFMARQITGHTSAELSTVRAVLGDELYKGGVLLVEVDVRGRHKIPNTRLPLIVVPHAEFFPAVHRRGNHPQHGRIEGDAPVPELMDKIRYVYVGGHTHNAT